MVRSFPNVPGLRRTAALSGIAVLIGAILVATGPADAQNRHRPKAVEKARKNSAPPPPPGPHLLIVSLKSQRAAFYANGTLIAHTPISSGKASHATPTGIFSVIQKNRHHRSNIYSNAPMPYMQRLTWSGIALHEGQLPGYPASHGCIRLPRDFANFLWRTTRLGARVIISHAKLFQPKARTTTVDAAPALRPSIDTDIATNTVTPIVADAVLETVGLTSEAKPAEASTTDFSAIASAEIPAPILASFFDTLEAKAKKAAPAGPVTIFISRKTKQLHVRQGFHSLFSVPVGFRDEQALVGTHVFTAHEKTDGGSGLRWIATSLPGEAPKAERKIAEPEYRTVYRYNYYGDRIPVRVKAPARAKPVQARAPSPAASDVLDRIDLPQEAIERVSEYVTAGATLIVSDHGISHETGAHTDFIVLTR